LDGFLRDSFESQLLRLRVPEILVTPFPEILITPVPNILAVLN